MMWIQVHLLLFVSSWAWLFTVTPAFIAHSRMGSSLSVYTRRPSSQLTNSLSVRAGFASGIVTEIEKVEGEFHDLVSVGHQTSKKEIGNSDKLSTSKVKCESKDRLEVVQRTKAQFESYDRLGLVGQMEILSDLQKRPEASNIKFAVAALFLLALRSDKGKRKDILHFFLEVSGSMFKPFPESTQAGNLGKIENQIVAREAAREIAYRFEDMMTIYKVHLQTQVDEIWNDDLKNNPLKSLIEPFIAKSSLPELWTGWSSELKETATGDWIWKDSYIVQLRILFSFGVMCARNPQELRKILKFFTDLSLSPSLSVEKRIATERALQALTQLTRNHERPPMLSSDCLLPSRS